MNTLTVCEASESLRQRVPDFYERNGYFRSVTDEDTILVAALGEEIVGAARLCPENGAIVLRGMQVLPESQRRGVGNSLLKECVARLGSSPCYCIPWAHLENFYTRGGFQRCEPSEAPDFLKTRYAGYLADGLDVILMRRAP
jgi:N-acetylglutamate synthase-like GNAT family acetyltransferase